MARETIIVDDFDGTGPANTYYFIVEDKEYSVDLSEENASKFSSLIEQYAEAMAPYMRAGRSLGKANPRRSTSSASASARDYDVQAVRDWAKENGYEVAERGRIKKEIVEAYKAQH